jgi:hypothetical protein
MATLKRHDVVLSALLAVAAAVIVLLVVRGSEAIRKADEHAALAEGAAVAATEENEALRESNLLKDELNREQAVTIARLQANQAIVTHATGVVVEDGANLREAYDLGLVVVREIDDPELTAFYVNELGVRVGLLVLHAGEADAAARQSSLLAAALAADNVQMQLAIDADAATLERQRVDLGSLRSELASVRADLGAARDSLGVFQGLLKVAAVIAVGELVYVAGDKLGAW